MPKVLLADDSTHAQRMGTKILSGEGIEVVSVSNGEAAVKKLAAAEFDVVFADVFMPGRTGYEVCNYIKNNAKYERIPVVLVVGQLEPFDPDQAKKVGADAVLKKPFEPTEVLKTMQAMLQLVEQRKPPPPPPKPSAEEVAANEAEDAKAMDELTASIPQQTAVRLEVPEDMQHHAAFDLFEAPTAAVAPGPAAEAAPAPSPVAPEVIAGPEPQPASVYGVEPAVVQPELPPTGSAGPEAVPIPELAPPEIQVEPELERFDSAPTPPPAQHWAAEPEVVTDIDRTAFPPPAATAVAEAPAPAPAPAAGGGEWADLLKSVEEPARVAVPEVAPAVEIEPAAPPEAVAAPPAPPAFADEPAPVETAPLSETASEVVAPEPVAASQAAAPVAAPAAPAFDAAIVRAAVEAAFDKVLPTMKTVPGLLDSLTEKILEHLSEKS